LHQAKKAMRRAGFHFQRFDQAKAEKKKIEKQKDGKKRDGASEQASETMGS